MKSWIGNLQLSWRRRSIIDLQRRVWKNSENKIKKKVINKLKTDCCKLFLLNLKVLSISIPLTTKPTPNLSANTTSFIFLLIEKINNGNNKDLDINKTQK